MCKNNLLCDGCMCPHGHPPCRHCVEDHDRIDGPHYHNVFAKQDVPWKDCQIDDIVYIYDELNANSATTRYRTFKVGEHSNGIAFTYFDPYTQYTLMEITGKKQITLGQHNKQRAAKRDQANLSKIDPDGPPTGHFQSTLDAIVHHLEAPARHQKALGDKYGQALHNALSHPVSSSLRLGDPHLLHL